MCVDGDRSDALYTIIREKLALIPDEPKLVIVPKPYLASKETLLVALPRGEMDHFQTTAVEILSKRWQTSDLISVMYEVQRTYPLKRLRSHNQGLSLFHEDNIIIQDTLSSIPKLQKRDENLQ